MSLFIYYFHHNTFNHLIQSDIQEKKKGIIMSDFTEDIKKSLRSNPQEILVGEIRDVETSTSL